MKQTAVDYLFSKLWDTERDKFEWQTILKKVKQIEKEQIEKAYYDGKWNDKFKTGLEYYEKKYENES
jgi:hypothetical protein